ncbi:MAG: guanylate kinase [Candidatus Omnitrophica bacterium]|nr:guanylate kinase [Candidatus Omnitrophota bacterium]
MLSGPSGAGKTTLHDLLLKSSRFSGRIVRSISATTRAPRGTEQNGREYLFVSPGKFEAMIRRGQFLEWAKVFDQYYGTPMKNVRDILKQGKSVLLCIDVQGGRQVKKKVPDAVAIFVKTPTLAELRRRLVNRRTDSASSVTLRLKTAREELKEAGCYDHVLVNDDLARAQKELESLLAVQLKAEQV